MPSQRSALVASQSPVSDAAQAERERLLVEFDAWLSFRPEFAEVLTAFRQAFGTNTSVAAEASR